MNWRADLRSLIDEVEVHEIPDVLGELARMQAIVQKRLQPPTRNGTTPKLDQYLTVEEVAERLSIGTKWVYDHADQLGAVHLSTRAVRFPERAVQRYLTARRSTR